MNRETIYFKRKLPHYQPEYATYFITFRLANSLPAEVVKKLREEREKELQQVGQDSILSYKVQKKYFAKHDEYLDRVNHGPNWLSDERIAKIVADDMRYWDGSRYELLCYCIMPNHVHVVLSINEAPVGQFNKLSYNLSGILHSIKRHSGREANKALHRTGAFWQHESYDRVVRKDKELERIVAYVLNNPVTAGLVYTWEKWRWSYVRNEIL